MMIAKRLCAISLLAPMLLLGGCLKSLMGGGKPDGLYRFGSLADLPLQSAQNTPQRLLLVMPVRFPAAAAGDRMLTVSGNEMAYLKDMRWISAASILFRDSLTDAVQRRAPDLALADRTTATRADAILAVDVDRFEASYDHGTGSPPTIHIAGSAALIDSATRIAIARRAFSRSIPASTNTIGGLVATIDAGSRQSVVELADWANITVPVNRVDLPRKSGKFPSGRRTR